MGPEANLWRSMRQNLPEGALAERIENRHGGGMSDVLLVWDVITLLVELKAPKALSKSWIVSDCKQKETFSGVKNIKFEMSDLTVWAAPLLSPEQIAFHARVIRAGGISFILARPQDTKVLELFCPVLGPAAPGSSPAAPGFPVDVSRETGPAAPGGVFHVKQALRLPAEGPALRLARVARVADWPALFAALRARACDHIRAGL